MYNNNNYSRSESLFDRLPKNEDGSLTRTESLFKGLSSTEDTSGVTYDYNYRDRTRPASITVVGVLLVITLVFGLVQVVNILPDAKYLPGWVWLVLVADYGLLIAAIVGLFQMRKYGAWTLLAQSVISTVFSLGLGATGTGVLNLIGSVIMLVFVFRKFDDMD